MTGVNVAMDLLRASLEGKEEEKLRNLKEHLDSFKTGYHTVTITFYILVALAILTSIVLGYLIYCIHIFKSKTPQDENNEGH